MFDKIKAEWAQLPRHLKILFSVVALMVALALFATPAAPQEYGEPVCTIVEGNPAVEVCEFDKAVSPVCHDQSDFRSPNELAEYYGGVVTHYGPADAPGGRTEFVLVIAIPDPETGHTQSMAFTHPGEVTPDTELCLRAVGRVVEGDLS